MADEVHLGVGDAHRLDLDVAVLHQQLDDFAGDDGDDLWGRAAWVLLASAGGRLRMTGPGNVTPA